ncbi:MULTISPECIES: ParB/RepB/Spo0J family partition protein [Sphingobium]|uniref:ParB/RepB/Spo0J family partition protein n=1 Tax=Sphingobium limneticum TaxID=1007511 RepID=A0A5J5HWC0_9SPHN|nr:MULTISPECIES: ParB/RepB/Spo0J family partition protein [Sphingobium]KAA9013974.1 ParB/RepB/Spo0J family partition protein [Sphingobium limneticum]KAA9014419.1 ParB/RepB/Spo0J family partition protein [Sphingobium limneticum]KAA9027130.1 ParB/RepB/Spo0J family partition protein [Sphingobium limneticum]BBD03477.1 chromosome partitioning protein, ParB family [Sphingobium sp. YG1]
MSRRSLISEALASVPAEPVVAPDPVTGETAAPGRVNFTNKRLEAFGEAARIVKRPTIRLKPAECSIWPGNARDYSLLDEHRLRSLIDSILAEGGNRIPAVVRRTPNGPLPYELVTGTRRHWAISWLNGNHYPDIDLIAIIEDLDDEAAFRLADIENREREDISDLERGLNYKAAVDRFYGGVQLRMAERLKISKSQLSRYIALTDIPPFLVSAFHSPMDLQAKYGEKLLPLLRDPASRTKLEAAADQIASEQSFRRSGDEQPIAGAEVMSRLLKAMTAKGRVQKAAIAGSNGKPIGEVLKDQQKVLTLTLTPSDLSTDAILEALRPVIDAARIRTAKRR